MQEHQNQTLAQESRNGKKFRLVVSSAEEAVRVIRDKLGDDAKVLSVKQIGGEGLKRFISSPKLEVIAEIPSQESNEPLEAQEKGIKEENSIVDNGEAIKEPAAKNDGAGIASLPENELQDDNSHLLDRAGFDPNLLREIKT